MRRKSSSRPVTAKRSSAYRFNSVLSSSRRVSRAGWVNGAKPPSSCGRQCGQRGGWMLAYLISRWSYDHHSCVAHYHMWMGSISCALQLCREATCYHSAEAPNRVSAVVRPQLHSICLSAEFIERFKFKKKKLGFSSFFSCQCESNTSGSHISPSHDSQQFFPRCHQALNTQIRRKKKSFHTHFPLILSSH